MSFATGQFYGSIRRVDVNYRAERAQGEKNETSKRIVYPISCKTKLVEGVKSDIESRESGRADRRFR